MIVEQLKSWIRPIYHACRALVYYPKARRILNEYSTHYREAQAIYQSAGTGPPAVHALRAMLVERVEPGCPGSFLSLPDAYATLIEQVHAAVTEQLRWTKNCLFFPKIQAASMPDLVEDVPSVQNGEVIAVQLRDYRSIEGLEELCRMVLPQLEQRVYGTHLVVDKVYIYRNLPSRAADQVSWTWHYDNHPSQIRKIMIYLTDVAEDTGPFEYVRAPGTGAPLYIPPTPLSGYGRVLHDDVERCLAEGYCTHKVTGPKGTLVFFEENVVHKANVAKRGCRDAVFFQIRPAAFKPDAYIDPRWTGSFQHVDFSPDPSDHRPRLKPNMLSA